MDAQEIRTDTPALPFCNLKLKSPKPFDRAYPTELRSIGDHVRKRRLDLGLLQREVALQIGVDETTVFNWEAGTATPSLRALPAVIRFLGYDPPRIPDAADWGGLVRYLRQRHGLSMDALAELLSVDPTTVRGWEQGEHKPQPRLYARLVEVLGLPAATADAGAAFGERFRTARLRVGVTERELAKRIGVAQQVVLDWETGKRTPTLSDGVPHQKTSSRGIGSGTESPG